MHNVIPRKQHVIPGLLVCLCSLFYTSSFSQKFLTTVYNTSYGLCTNTVYCAEQDENGYMWLGTDDGLVRFDGKEFIRLGIENGLSGNFILSVRNYKKDTLAVLCFRKGIDLVNIHNFSTRQTNMVTNDYNELGINKNRIVSSSFAGVTLNVFENQKPILHLDTRHDSIKNIKSFNNVNAYKDILYVSTNVGCYSLNSKYKLEEVEPELRGMNLLCSIRDKAGDLIVTMLGKVLRIRDHKIINTYQHGIPSNCILHHLMIASDNAIWATGRTGLLFRISGDEVEEVSKKVGLENQTISRTFEDRNHNIWVMSLAKGLIKISANYFVNYGVRNGLSNTAISKLCLSSTHDLWIGTWQGLNYLGNNQAKIDKVGAIQLSKMQSPFFLFENSVGKLLVCYKTKRYDRLGDELRKKYSGVDAIWKLRGRPYTEFIKYKNHSIVNLGMDYLFYLPKTGNYLSLRARGLSANVLNNSLTHFEKMDFDDTTLAEGENFELVLLNGNYYLSSSKGFFHYDGDTKFTPIIRPDTNLGIYQMLLTKQNTMLLATSNGIWEYDEKYFYNHIKLGDDIPGKFCTSLCYDSDGNLWAGTKNGLYKVNKNNEVNVFKTSNGLTCNSINTLLFDSLENKLWIGTDDGLSSLQIKSLSSAFKPDLHLNVQSAKANDTLSFQKEDALKYNQNNVSFELSTPYYGDIDNLQYEYRIKNTESFKKIEGNILRLVGLSNDEYSIEFRSHDLESNTYSRISGFDFSILPPYYKTWWFRFIISFVCLFLLFMVIQYLIKRKHQQLQLEKELAISQHQTHSASINPHFIFNALNSVQHFMNLNDRLSANRFLTNFAKLIRKNFNATKQLDTTISDEIETLQIYLNLEKMRQPDKFDYEINVDHQLETEAIKIPVMIVQPFIENSILHGFGKSLIKGKLQISFRKADDKRIEIIISDNGIGEINSQENKGDHKSSGKDLTQQRLELYGKIKGLEMKIDLYPFNPNNKENPGQVVRIELPM